MVFKKGHKVPREWRENTSRILKIKFRKEGNPFYKKKHTKETKEKIGSILKRRNLSKLHKEKIGNALKGHKGWGGRQKDIKLIKDSVCKYCEKDFFDYLSNKRVFCSKNCSNRFQKENVKIREENPFYGKTHTKKVRRKISLSRKGKHPEREFKKGHKPWNYIDGRSKKLSPGRYGDDWFKIRFLIYSRDNYTCQDCHLKMSKETGAFHVHHILPFLISFDNSLKNLITLCPPCHRKEEAKIMMKLKQQKVEV